MAGQLSAESMQRFVCIIFLHGRTHTATVIAEGLYFAAGGNAAACQELSVDPTNVAAREIYLKNFSSQASVLSIVYAA